MGLDALLARLEARPVTPVTPSETLALQPKPAPMLACTLVTPVTPQKQQVRNETRIGLQVVSFRLKIDPPGVWHTALGPDVADLIADLRGRYGARLDGVKVRP